MWLKASSDDEEFPPLWSGIRHPVPRQISGGPDAHETAHPSRFLLGSGPDMNMEASVSSTGKGILIGMLSAFSSAAFVAVVFAVVYFFRYTRKGRIILDRIGRPGEFDDEQALAREEEQALERMDELQRAEYFRAKGACMTEIALLDGTGLPRGGEGEIPMCWDSRLMRSKNMCSLRRSESARVHADGHLAVAIPRHPGEGRVGVGV